MRGWIRVELGTEGAIATLHAVVHRLPRTIPISLAAARRLAADGLPLVVRP